MVCSAIAWALSGCGGDDQPVSQEQPPASEETATGEDVATVDAGTDTEATETAPAPEEALASRESTVDGLPVRLDIVELARTGETAALTLQLTLVGGGASDSAQVAQTFDDGLSDITGGRGQDAFTLDGVSLIDADNAQRYLVARDSGGVCVCDGNLAGKFVEPDAPLTLSATFGAPPEDVEAVDVVVPSFGTFKGVPIS